MRETRVKKCLVSGALVMGIGFGVAGTGITAAGAQTTTTAVGGSNPSVCEDPVAAKGIPDCPGFVGTKPAVKVPAGTGGQSGSTSSSTREAELALGAAGVVLVAAGGLGLNRRRQASN